ncbi:DUF2207 domain-containing protein [Geitlerinema sp. PCC 9228]|uniref:DUF2207 domain-containing protein n=1 Tax=Geitlerinema sp. PCC 9228 TaxID=111611 RepID=UPI0008F9ADA4|nr:DUF2207 domain-containing protein [Geitlerinema sp. PCC 9228]
MFSKFLPNHRYPFRWLTYLTLGLFCAFFFGVANAQTNETIISQATTSPEIIKNYNSNIAIQDGGRLQVTENITVQNRPGGPIEHGIYRYFPNPDFQVISVRRNGEPTTYRTEVKSDRKRIEIWKPDVDLDVGTYTYQIQYRTDRQIQEKGNRNRLYWNVTGQDWEFPIQQVRAQIRLPAGISADEVNLKAFVGERGEKGKSYEISFEQEGETVYAIFSTTRTLRKGEGISTIVEFPTGYISQPNLLERLTFQLSSNYKAILLLVLSVGSVGLSSFGYHKARQVAYNCPLYLTLGEQSRVQSGFGGSPNSNQQIFPWVSLGSSAAILAIVFFVSVWFANDFETAFLVSIVVGGVFGFLLAFLRRESGA